MSKQGAQWERLQDRLTLGEELSPEEMELCSRHETQEARDDLERGAWDAMIDDLRDQARALDDITRARAARLGKAVLEQRRIDRSRADSHTRPTRLTGTVGIAAAAAAVVVAGLIGVAVAGGWSDTRPGKESAHARAQHEREVIADDTASLGREPTAPPAAAATEVTTKASLQSVLTLIEGEAERNGEHLAVGDSIGEASMIASVGGRSCLTFELPYAAVCLDDGARIEIVRGASPGSRTIALERGRVIVSLDALDFGQQFQVTTFAGSVTAVGTIFEVEVAGDGVQATVSEGAVSVADAAGERTLHVGQRTWLHGDRRVVGGTPAQAETADVAALARGLAVGKLADLWRASERGTLAVAVKGARGDAQVSVDGIAVGPAPITLLAGVGRHRVAVAGALAEQTQEVEIQRASVALLTAYLPVSRGKEATASEEVADQLWQRAQVARKAGDYEAAADLYQRMLDEHPGDPRTRHVGVRLGDLLLEPDPRRALRAYERYLERPGDLAPEAEYGRIRALRGLGERAAERGAIEGFLAAHPADPRASILRQRLSDL